MSGVHELTVSDAHQVVGPGLLLVLILLAAVTGGYVARLLRVPKVVGYLVAGVLLRYTLVGLLSPGEGGADGYEPSAVAAEPLQPIKTLTLGLILFWIGSVFERGHLKMVGPKVFRISLVEIVSVVSLVATGCTLAWLVGGPNSTGNAVACGALLGALAIATAPAATVLVLREYEAKGPVSDMIQTLTALNNAACIILFHIVFLMLSTFGVIGSAGGGVGFLSLGLLFTTLGSVALGIGLGFIASVLYSKVPLTEMVLILLALLLGLGEGARYLSDAVHLSYSFLLVSLALGAAFANLAVDQERLHESLRSMAGPIFATFFVLAGYELHLSDVGTFGLLGVSYVLLRVLGKCLGGYLGIRWAGSPNEIPPYVGIGLLCQAGVAIGLVDFLCNTWGTQTAGGYVVDPLAYRLKTVVLGSVVIFELAGPLVLKGVAVQSGEVKAITLLRRHRTPMSTSGSMARLTWDALRRAMGMRRRAERSASGPLQVRHIMRSNIKLLPASADLDEVLHFVETSRYNDFPVADEGGQFVGMIHFSELRKIIYDPALRQLVAAIDLADPESHLTPPDLSLDDLLNVFKEADTGLLPVVEAGGSRKVIGLVEQRDLLRALHQSDEPKPSY